MASNAQRVKFENIRSLAFGSITTSYVAVGDQVDNPVRMIAIDNLSNANLLVSFDGVNDHTVVPAISGRVFDYASNRVGPEDRLEQPVNTQVYVKREGGAPSSGSVYVTVMFASGK
jgi:hypothetical protein